MNNTEAAEFAELDDFFRRGEQYSSTSQSLEPPMVDIGESLDDDEAGNPSLRTPDQIARRQKFTRYVSVTMVGLVLGLVFVFANQALALKSGTASGPPVTAVSPVGPVISRTEPVAVAMRNLAEDRKLAAVSPIEPVLPANETTVGAVQRSAHYTRQTRVTDSALTRPSKTAVSNGKTQMSTSRGSSQSVASPKVTLRAQKPVVAAVAQTSIANVPGKAKPTDYRPPTASFGD